MIKKLSTFIGLGLIVIAGGPAQAQSYSNAVMALSPSAYWPLNETTPPPQPLNLTAANLGALGAAGNGYYGAWYQPFGTTWYLTNNIAQTNAVTYPFDGSKAMLCQFSPGQYVVVPRNTNGVAKTGLTLSPPFSIEAWLRIGTTAGQLGDIVSQGGFVNVNTAGPNTNDPFYGGLGTGWAGVQLGQYQDYLFIICQSTNGQSKANELDTSGYNQHKGFNVGDWVHVVATFDGTTEAIWTNGVLSASKTVAANPSGVKYVPDPTTPLMIGSGSDVAASYGVSFTGTIHDVAIYSNILSQTSILNHYQTAYGTNATYGSVYTNAVLADSPMLYYRLNDPVTQTSAGYPSGTFPVANNYGSLGTAANAVYQPGTTPGVAGPAYAGFGANSKAVAFNGWLGSVDVGGGSLPASLNPTNTAPLTVVSWFQTGPADAPGRFQEILGHGDSSYRLSLGQVCGENHFNPGPGPELQFTAAADVASNGFAFNDGKWHMVAGVSDGTNEFMYLDGILAKSATTTNGIKIVGNGNDLLIGGDSQYTFASVNTANTDRTFDGQVAQVAFWNSALSSSQIQQLYSAAGVPPYFFLQPLSITNNAGNNVTNASLARGASPLTYQWYQNGSAVSGQTNASLILNPASTGNAGNYYVIANNPYGSATSAVVAVVLYGPPTIQSQSLTDIRVFAGQSPTLHVSAAGAQPIHYQWSVNSSPIPGATSSNYTVVNAQSSGTYTCTLSNFVSTAAIAPITLTVLTDPTAPYPLAVLNDHPAAFWRLDETSGTTAYDYAGGDNATYTNVQLDYTGMSGYAPQSDSDPFPEFGALANNNSYAGNVPGYINFGAPNGSNAEFSVEAWVNAFLFENGGNGIISIGYGNGGEEFVLDTGAANNGLRFFVRNAAGTVSAANSAYSPVNDGIWHHVVGVCDEANGHVYLYLDGNLTASGAIAAGTGVLSSTLPLTIGARQSGNTNPPNYDFQFIGTISQAAVYNTALSASQVKTHYLASGVAPVITQIQPFNLTTNQGANVSFTVTASGSSPLTYQWYDPNNNPISTSNVLTLSNVQQSQSGTYSVVVTDPYGTASTNTSLTVYLGPPVITVDLQPLNVTVYAGNAVTYSVTASGSLPLYYQWYKDNVPVANATNTSYTFTALQGTNTYYVAVTNIYSYSQNGGPTYSSTGTVAGISRPVLNPVDYTYKEKITFSGYTSNETLLNFPALVNLGTNMPGFSFSQFASPTGGDLRFTDASGSNEIPHEIDEWENNGVSTVWVQVPALASNTVIWAYWGNPAATTPVAWSTNGEVWVPPSFEGLPAYEVVYHLKEGAFPFLDSTLNATANNGVAPAATPGIVGTGGNFTGSSWLDAGTNDVGQEFTLSAWVKIPQVTSIQTIWANQHGGYGAPGFALWVNTYNNSDGILDLGTGDGAGGGNETRSASGAVTFGAWHLIEAAINRTNGTSSFYVDGADILDGSAVVKDFTTLADLRLGIFTDLNFGLHGTMDEARIRQGSNSAAWVWADYMTVAQNTAFESYAAVNSSAVTLTYQVSGNNLILTWSQGTLQSSSQANGTYANVAGAASPYSVPMTGPSQFYRVLVR